MAPGPVVAAGGHHHLAGFQFPFRSEQSIALALALQAQNAHPLPHIGLDPGRETAQVGDDLLPAHEALGIVAVVGEIGQAALPIGSYQAEGIPALLLPGVANPVALQH